MTSPDSKQKLAIHGGKPAKTVPYGTGLRFGREEEEAAAAAVRSQKLWYKQGGTRVKATEKSIGEMWNVEHAICCSSGTAAVHTALAMCGVGPGDEVIVNPITDWGSVAGILALGAVPVFCDISLETFSLDPAAVEKAITGKTKVIEVVHMSGYPAHITEIVEIAHTRGIKVVEDCAQAHYASLGGKLLGSLGDVGAFSTNDSKHITCGEGGFVITNDDQRAEIGRRFIDKGYQAGKDRGKNTVSLAGFNYRMSELSAAVLSVQLQKLPGLVAKRRDYAEKIINELKGIPGYQLLPIRPEACPAFWFILGYLEPGVFKADHQEIVKALAAEGLHLTSGLAPVRTLYSTDVIRRTREYRAADFPVTERIADTALMLFSNQFYTDQDAAETVAGMKKVLDYFRA